MSEELRDEIANTLVVAAAMTGSYASDVLADALLSGPLAPLLAAQAAVEAKALRDAADWLEDDDGAPVITSLGQVLIADREAAFSNVVWAAQSLRDRAGAL